MFGYLASMTASLDPSTSKEVNSSSNVILKCMEFICFFPRSCTYITFLTKKTIWI
jgi:hypothetical protein